MGRQLGVEELEERIAPAAVTLDAAGEVALWDVSGNGALNADDGILVLGTTSAGFDTMVIADITDNAPAVPDTATLNLTFTDSAAGDVTLVIATNQAIGNIDLTGLTLTAGNTVTLIVASGTEIIDQAVADGVMEFSIDGTAYVSGDLGTAGVLTSNSTGAAWADGADFDTEVVDAGIGTITLPATAGVNVRLVVVAGSADGAGANASGAITSITSTAAISLTSTGAAAGTEVYGATLGTLNLPLGTIDGLSGGVLIDIVTSIGAVDVAGVTVDGTNLAGDVTINAGTTGFTSTVDLGNVVLDDTGGGADADITVSTTTNGSFAGLVTVGTITNSGTNDNDLTIQPVGTGTMAGFTATGLISNTAVLADGTMTIGSTTGALGNVTLAGITVASTSGTGGVTFQGESIGAVNSSAAIQTAAGAAGDILFNAAGAAATGSMGTVTVTNGGIVAGQAGATITFQANDDMGNINVTGNVGGAGAIAFTADNGGTADTGNMGTIDVSGIIGNGAGTVAFAAVDIGAITAGSIGTGGAAVTFTADGANATNGAGGGVIGTLTVTDNVAHVAGSNVTFTADDGMGIVTIGGDAALNANLTFNVNVDGLDDTGAMGAISAQSLGDADNNDGTVTVNTNGGATDNTTERGVGAITASDGTARLSITADGDVGLITVSGGNGANGNDVDIVLLNLDAAADGTNADIPDFAGITIEDTLGTADTLTLLGAWTIPGTMGPIQVGGSDATDVMALGANNINVYSGDDVADGFDAAYASAVDNNISITAGNVTGTGIITANTRAASDLLTYVKDGETFAVTTASDVTATLAFEPDPDNTPATNDERVTITNLAGTAGTNDLSVTTTGASAFDVAGITPAADGLNIRNIIIEGDLLGNIGTAALSFGAVNTVIIQGADNANTLFADSLAGYASTDGTLVTTGVNVLTLDTPADGSEDLTLAAGTILRFADAAGALADVFNHHIAVPAGIAGAEAVIRGIDGAGDSTAVAEYLFDGSGLSAAQTGATNDIDPLNLIDGAAMISHIILTGTGGLGTDVSVREVSGSTNGSWLEFNTDIGLINLTTQVDSVSVGVDDNADLVDNVVVTGIAGASVVTRAEYDRLGGGEAGANKSGLQAATFISDVNAALGNMVVQSIGDPGAANINLVVTGNCGPVTLTGDTALLTPDHGNWVVNNTVNSAAIAIGGNLAGALTIPGAIDDVAAAAGSFMEDILIGIGLDLNGDGDVVDTALDEVTVGHDLNGDGDAVDLDLYDELPGGSLNGLVTIGDAADTDILVYNMITSDIVITGADQDPEAPGLELVGSLNGVKAGQDIGDDDGVAGAETVADVVIVAGQVDYVIADGALNSGIFSGGLNDGDLVGEVTVIEGTGINGPAVIGGAHGIDQVTLINHDAFGDLGDTDTIAVAGAEIVVQWAAGGVNNDTLGDVYVLDAGAAALAVATVTGDAMVIGNIFVVDAPAAAFAITSPSNVGVLVVADDVNTTAVPLSDTLLNNITTAYEVIYAPSALDTATGDENNDLAFNGEFLVENAGGVVAEGDIVVSAGGFIADGTFGYIVSLNGLIDATNQVCTGLAIGHIVASGDIDGSFISEGTIAIGTATAMQTQITGWGLEGVPAWFPGGILSETGDIGSNEDANIYLDTGTPWEEVQFGVADMTEAVFRAAADPIAVQGNMFWTGTAMGTMYVPAGSMSADISVGGGFGGIQVPAGVVWVQLQVPMEATVDRVIAPQFFDGSVGHNAGGNAMSSWDIDGVRGGIRVIDGELVAVVGAPVNTVGLDVVVYSPTAIAIIDGVDILLVGGLANDAPVATPTELEIQGNVDDLTVDGNWEGQVLVEGNADDDSAGVVDTLIVTGNVTATADLTAFNFNEVQVQGTNAAEATGTLTGRDSVQFVNLAGMNQTLALDASNNVSAEWTTVFGKMTEVNLVGRGSASVLSLEGNIADETVLRRIANDARAGRANANLVTMEGMAHVGYVAVSAGSKVNVKDVLVNGDLGDLDATNVRSLWVSDDAGSIDIGNKINKAFIGNDVQEFSARVAQNVLIGGDANFVSAFKMIRSTVAGTTNFLNIDGALIYSTFADTNAWTVNRIYRSVLG